MGKASTRRRRYVKASSRENGSTAAYGDRLVKQWRKAQGFDLGDIGPLPGEVDRALAPTDGDTAGGESQQALSGEKQSLDRQHQRWEGGGNVTIRNSRQPDVCGQATAACDPVPRGCAR